MRLDTAEKFRVLVRFLFVCCLLITLLLAAFQWLPLAQSNLYTLLNLTNSQEWHVERIAKDALLLEQGGNQTLAINELQSELPSFETNEQALASDTLPISIQILFLDAKPNYGEVNRAVLTILANPTKNQSLEAGIILSQEREFFLDYTQMSATLNQQIASGFVSLFGIEIVLDSLLVIGGVLLLITTERSTRALKREVQTSV